MSDIRAFAWARLTALSCLSLAACGRSPLDLPVVSGSDAAVTSRDTGRDTGGIAATGGMFATGGVPSTIGAGGAAGRGGGGGSPTGGVGGTGGLTGRGGSAGGIGGAGGAGGSVADLLQPLASVFCTAAKTCCAGSYPPANLADCESRFPSRLQLYPLLEKGTVTVDQAALNACVGAYKAATTTCTVTGIEAACRGMFIGAQAEGQPCGGTGRFGSRECKPLNGTESCYWQDSKSYPNEPGVCLSIPRGKSGDLCSTTCLENTICVVDIIGAGPVSGPCFEEDGLYCSVGTNPAVCKPILHLGDTCTWDPNVCGSGRSCSGMSNTCADNAKIGESCLYSYCREDLTCGNGRTCVEQPFASDTVCQGTPSAP